jgi:hypothetical protein
MSDVTGLCEMIAGALPAAKKGSLRIWGEWFGKPHDNWHMITRCHAEGDLLVIDFDGGEHLRIWRPEALVVNETTFRVSKADRVRWEWPSYGGSNPQHVYFEDFIRSEDGIKVTTNIDWYDPHFAPSSKCPAAELL